MPRVHCPRLPRRDLEESRVELGNPRDGAQERPRLTEAIRRLLQQLQALCGELRDSVNSVTQDRPELLYVAGLRETAAHSDNSDESLIPSHVSRLRVRRSRLRARRTRSRLTWLGMRDSSLLSE